MHIRCFTLEHELHYTITDILEVLGYSGAAQMHGRKKVLANVSAGDITIVSNGVVGKGSRQLTVVNKQGLEDIMDDYPELADYMGL